MIKSNIDLTSNEMFSRNSSVLTNVERRRHRWILSPWQTITEHSYLHDGLNVSSQIILTGNRDERAEKKLYIEENSGNHCDCCGRYLLDIPWDRTYGLCRRCQKDMDDRFGNRPEDRMQWLKITAEMRRRGHNPLIW